MTKFGICFAKIVEIAFRRTFTDFISARTAIYQINQ